jgi:hypothetical protein
MSEQPNGDMALRVRVLGWRVLPHMPDAMTFHLDVGPGLSEGEVTLHEDWRELRPWAEAERMARLEALLREARGLLGDDQRPNACQRLRDLIDEELGISV